jgi:hypothetical protein
MALGGSEVLIGLGVASVLATAAGTYVAYEGAQQQAAAAREKGDYDKAVSDINANTVSQQAGADAALHREKVRRAAGAQEAAIAKTGGSLDQAGDIMYDLAVQGELDALTTEYKGQVTANRYRQGGELSLLEGNNAAAAASTRGTGSLISGIAATADRSYDLYKSNPKMS